MTSLIDYKNKLKTTMRFQETPIVLDDFDYLEFTIAGAKRLYVDAGLETWDIDFNKTTSEVNRVCSLTEQEYISVASQVEFLNQIKNFWTTILSYTTNALSVTGSANVFKSIDGNVTALEDRLAKLAFKFTHKQVT